MATSRAAYWTEPDDQFIEMHWQQMTDRELADRLGRSEVAVSSRRAALRFLRADTGEEHRGVKRWSDEEDARIREMFAADCSDEDIAIALGRSIGAVAQHRSSIGLRRFEQPEHLKTSSTWSDDDDQLLSLLFRRDKSDEEIGRTMDRTAAAVKDRRQTLGLWRAPRG